MRKLVLYILLLVSFVATSQELNCNVVVNAQFTGNQNVQVFRTLERELSEFINNRKWTNKNFKPQERINCSMVITIDSNNGTSFSGTLQVQSIRPVFNSSYETPIYNFNDRDFTFEYIEFQNLLYSENQFESNLISVIAFHVYMILGMDADSFELNGGNEYYDQAREILNYSQSENFRGWSLQDGLQSRFVLIDNMQSPTFQEFRNTLYNYHLKGLDVMSENSKDGKEAIASTITDLKKMNSRRPNSFLLRVFFDAKSDELLRIFSDGPSIDIRDMVDDLYKIAPTYSSKWRNIKF